LAIGCKSDSDTPASQEPVYMHIFIVKNQAAYNGTPTYVKTYYMLTALPTDPVGTISTLSFTPAVTSGASATVGGLQLPNDGFYTLKVYATDGSYIKWDRYYMAKNGRTTATVVLYPSCQGYGSNPPYLSQATDVVGGSGGQSNTGHHINDNGYWCDSNP
jgi:hypothetical protein